LRSDKSVLTLRLLALLAVRFGMSKASSLSLGILAVMWIITLKYIIA